MRIVHFWGYLLVRFLSTMFPIRIQIAQKVALCSKNQILQASNLMCAQQYTMSTDHAVDIQLFSDVLT